MSGFRNLETLYYYKVKYAFRPIKLAYLGFSLCQKKSSHFVSVILNYLDFKS
jgi:hypothetical protein